MLFDEEKHGGGPRKPDPARERYSTAAGQTLRETKECSFSFLPYPELVRISAGWYAASADAMLQGNYGPIEDWVRAQASVAAEQGFELEDLLELLRICRRTAIQTEGWVEDQMEAVDEIIDEALAGLDSQVGWQVPTGLQYVTGLSEADREAARRAAASSQVEPATAKAEPAGERRIHKRAYLKLPVRVRGWAGENVDEVVHTENVARGGVYFASDKDYAVGLKVQAVYPYWGGDEVQEEYPAEVVRVDKRDKTNGVAVRFLVSLGK